MSEQVAPSINNLTGVTFRAPIDIPGTGVRGRMSTCGRFLATSWGSKGAINDCEADEHRWSYEWGSVESLDRALRDRGAVLEGQGDPT